MPLGTEVGLGPGHIVLDGDPAPAKGAQPRNFRLVSLVAKRSPISATAEHLFARLVGFIIYGESNSPSSFVPPFYALLMSIYYIGTLS